ncbi:ATP-binding protein [Streptomyces sp. NPDC020845]|uniref:ATP-binding protein n=1 Tax=Streptomyces sp. NPDC020845 TaxID=3365096 RepID=UPI0037B20BDC
MAIEHCMPRKAWRLPFLAEPGEVPALRRSMRTYLTRWGLPDVIDAALICVSELVTNVIVHVGAGTPATMAVSMNGTYLRIEIHDPDRSALPTLLGATTTSESGRGLALVMAVTDRWGVMPTDAGKTTWCEIATELSEADAHLEGPQVDRAEALLTLYGRSAYRRESSPHVGHAIAEEAAIALISDLLHWFRAHGQDPDTALDRAQLHFEAEVGHSGDDSSPYVPVI